MISLLDFNLPEWTERAACTAHNPELWFPHEAANPNAARKICRTCPVTTECLQLALDAEGDASRTIRFGIYAGKTPEQRHAIAKKRRSA